jgi:hypothetical protein
MRALALLPLLALGACTTTPYDDLAWEVKQAVKYTSQPVDQAVYGCRAEGDCDDRALCAACKLVQQGVDPAAITVVVQGWPGANPKNHMSLEYNGHCLLGYAGLAQAGPCTHMWKNATMRTTRTPLPAYLQRSKAVLECATKPEQRHAQR